MIRTLAALVALFVVGCSKPVRTVTGTGGSTLTVSGTAAAKTIDIDAKVAPTFPADQPPLPKSKAAITAAFEARGFTLEPFDTSDLHGGTSGFFVKGAPVGVVYDERDGKLLMVEAITKADPSGKHTAEIVGFGETVCEIATGLPRETVGRLVALMKADADSPHGQISIDNNQQQRFTIDVTRHDHGGYSFKFTMAAATAK